MCFRKTEPLFPPKLVALQIDLQPERADLKAEFGRRRRFLVPTISFWNFVRICHAASVIYRAPGGLFRRTKRKTKKMRHLMSAALIAGAAVASPALAQVAGTYSGTAKDGSNVAFTVTTDAATGKLAVTSASVNFTAPCRGFSYTLYQGEGYGLTADITDGAVSNTTYYPNFYIYFSLKFAKNGKTATGLEQVIAPALYTAKTPPARSLFCESPKQSMSVSLQTSAARPPVAPKTYVYDSKGRIIGEVTH
jgi:hypothetical protein